MFSDSFELSSQSSSASFSSDFNDERAKVECTYIKPEPNASAEGSFDINVEPDSRNDDLIIDIANVLAKMYRSDQTSFDDQNSYQSPVPSTTSSPNFHPLASDHVSPVQYNHVYSPQPTYPAQSAVWNGWSRYSTSYTNQSTPVHSSASQTPNASFNSLSSVSFGSREPYTPPVYQPNPFQPMYTNLQPLPQSSYRPRAEVKPTPNTLHYMPKRTDSTNACNPPPSRPEYSYANFTSQFRPPINLANDFFSGRDELREYNYEETPEQLPSLSDDTRTNWSGEDCPLETCEVRNPSKCTPSFQDLLETITQLARQKTTRGRKRKQPDSDDIARPAEKKPLACSVPGCSTKVASKKDLKLHMKTHVAPESPFECHICKKLYSAKSSLKVHMRIHTGDKPYGCKYCQCSFRDFSTYTKHQRTHTGERPYTCAVCGVGFTQSGNLKRHFLSQHQEYDFFTTS